MGMFLKTKRGVSALSTPICLKQPFRSGVSIRNALRLVILGYLGFVLKIWGYKKGNLIETD